MTTILRPLSTSELLDRTFHLYRNNFMMFVGIAAVPQVVVFALRVSDILWLRQAIRFPGTRMVGFYLAGFVAIQVCHAATVCAVSSLHLGHPSSIWSAYRSAKRSLPRVVGIALVAFALPFILGILVGLVALATTVALFASEGAFPLGRGPWIGMALVFLLFVAAPLFSITWWVRWSLVVPVTVLEGGGLRASMRRSRTLSAGRRWRVFVIYVLVLALTWTVVVLLKAPFYAMIQWRAFLQPVRISSSAAIFGAISNFASYSLVSPLLTIALTLIYYDERIRREGFDLQVMIATLERAPENPVAAPAL